MVPGLDHTEPISHKETYKGKGGGKNKDLVHEVDPWARKLNNKAKGDGIQGKGISMPLPNATQTDTVAKIAMATQMQVSRNIVEDGPSAILGAIASLQHEVLERSGAVEKGQDKQRLLFTNLVTNLGSRVEDHKKETTNQFESLNEAIHHIRKGSKDLGSKLQELELRPRG